VGETQGGEEVGLTTENQERLPMTEHDRAAQLWSLLVFAARNQKILSYHNLEQLTGLAQQGGGNCLAPIQNYCEHHRLPPLTSIVVNERTGMPSESLMEAKDIFAAQARVFVYDWFAHKAPTPEDFQKISN
jgi:hypothetical protein